MDDAEFRRHADQALESLKRSLLHAEESAEIEVEENAGALKIAERLVQDAGFEPVVVGPLAKAKEFDAGTPVFGKALTASELRKSLGIGS